MRKSPKEEATYIKFIAKIDEQEDYNHIVYCMAEFIQANKIWKKFEKYMDEVMWI